MSILKGYWFALILCFALLTSLSLACKEQIEILCWNPRIVIYHDFLSFEECDYLMITGTPFLEYSPSQSKKSKSMCFSTQHTNPVLLAVEKKISLATLIPQENGQGIQLLHYLEGEKEEIYFDLEPKKNEQRIASFYMYLNSPKKGGETIFPLLNIKIQPKKGDALFFFDCDFQNLENKNLLNSATPLIKGDKWIAIKWFSHLPSNN